MKDNNYNLFQTKELDKGLVILKVNLVTIKQAEAKLFMDTITLLLVKNYKKIIIDFSETDYLDSAIVALLIDKINEVNATGGSVSLVVSEDKPRLTYSLGNPVSKFNVYLTVEKALRDVVQTSG